MSQPCPYCGETKSALKNHVRLASGGGHGPSGTYPDSFDDRDDRDRSPTALVVEDDETGLELEGAPETEESGTKAKPVPTVGGGPPEQESETSAESTQTSSSSTSSEIEVEAITDSDGEEADDQEDSSSSLGGVLLAVGLGIVAGFILLVAAAVQDGNQQQNNDPFTRDPAQQSIPGV